MANEKRLKGQECFVNIVQDGAVTDVFRAVASFSFTDQLEVLDDGFIGETTNRKDSVYNGTDFSMEAQFQDESELVLREALINRARRQAGAVTRVDIAFTYVYPTGAARQITLLDCEFGNIEFSTGGRAEMVTGSFEGSCPETQVVTV